MGMSAGARWGNTCCIIWVGYNRPAKKHTKKSRSKTSAVGGFEGSPFARLFLHV